MRKLKDHPFVAPLLVGVYPALALLAANIVEIAFTDALRAILVSFLGSGIILIILVRILRNREKAAILTSLYVILFFTYGHVYLFLERGGLFGLSLGRHRYLAPLYLIMFLGVSWNLWRTKHPMTNSLQTVTLIAGFLVILPILQIGFVKIRTLVAGYNTEVQTSHVLHTTNGEPPPDIYYILLDGYPRADILRTTFGYDNHTFLDFLTAQGFYVAPCSQSNYSYTLASLASTLNMKYIHEDTSEGIDLLKQSELEALLQDSEVQALVESAGYATVSFETGYQWLRWPQADYYFSAFANTPGQAMFQTGLNEFELLLVKTSAALLLSDLQVTSAGNQAMDVSALLEVNPRRVHQERFYFDMETLQQIPDTIPSPKFVYAHITSPHPPLIFDAQGNFILNEPTGEDQRTGYRDQIIYLNTRITDVVTTLLAHSEQPPIILIQGDHGARINYPVLKIDKNEKMANLSAFYFPGQNYSRLYPTITPVNSFRLVFDQFLNGDFELLADQSYLDHDLVQLPCSE